MTPERFRNLISAVADAANIVCELTPSAWDAQNRVLVSPEGIAYLNGLEAALLSYVRSMGNLSALHLSALTRHVEQPPHITLPGVSEFHAFTFRQWARRFLSARIFRMRHFASASHSRVD